MTAKVSVITVCYNSEKTVENTILSVLAQSYSNVEYIVVDGASNDGTLSILNKYKDSIDKIITEKDKGIYDAMNKGISSASGEIVGLLNSDDIYSSNTVLEDVVKTFEVNTGKDIVIGKLWFVDFLSRRVVRSYNMHRFKPWQLRFGWMPPHPSTFVRKSVYNEHGLYSIDFKIAADYEKFVKWLLVKKVSYVIYDSVLIYMRVGGVSTAGLLNSITLNREIVKACRNNDVYTNLVFLIFKIPVKLTELRSPRLFKKDTRVDCHWQDNHNK